MLEYTLLDYDPVTDGDEVEWARRIDADGWRTWHETGVCIEVNGRLRRWSLRKRPRREEPDHLTASPPAT